MTGVSNYTQVDPLDAPTPPFEAHSTLSWNGGRALNIRHMRDNGGVKRFSSGQHGMFFGVHHPANATRLRIDGKLLVDSLAPNPRTIILPSGSEIVKERSEASEIYDYIAVFLDPDFVLRAGDASHIAGVEITPSVDGGDDLAWQLSNAIRDEIEAGAPGGSLYLETAATLLSLYLLRHHSNIDQLRLPVVKGGLSHQQLRTAIDYIASHLAADITLGELAHMMDLSASHFSRAFKMSTGLSPHGWRMKRRLERAQDLLANTTMPIAEVALACGFANQSHFTKAFRDAVCASPAAWRRERLL